MTPLQYAAPMRAPTLVPATKLIGIFSASRALRTPTWTMPRANPPPRARPILTGLCGVASPDARDIPRPKSRIDRTIFCKPFMATLASGLVCATTYSKLDAAQTRVPDRRTLYYPNGGSISLQLSKHVTNLFVPDSLRQCYERFRRARWWCEKAQGAGKWL